MADRADDHGRRESMKNALREVRFLKLTTSDTVATSAAVIALIALGLSGFTFYWATFRPAHLILTMTSATVTRHGGVHLTIPLSIANDGAQATTVLGLKVIESLGESKSIYIAALTTTPDKAVEPMFGAIAKADAALFVPFVVGPGTENQRFFILVPLAGPGLTGDLIAKSNSTVRYQVIILTSNGETSITKEIAWRPELDAFLSKGSGFTQPTVDMGEWQESPHLTPL